MRDVRSNLNRGPQYQLLDPDHLEMTVGLRVPEQAKKRASMRLPPQPFHFLTHDYTLVDALIEALGDLGYAPAVNALFELRGTDYDSTAARALSKIAPERLAAELVATAKDTKTDSYLRERAMVTLSDLSLTSRARDLVPLLDDVTPIVYAQPMRGPQWRVCDRAAASIAILLGWENPMMLRFLRPEQREGLMKRAREWAKSDQ
jgi:hypothetical protein